MDEGGGEEKEKEGGESVIGFQEHPVNFHHLDLLRKKVLGPVEVETDVRPALQRVIFNVVNFSKTKSLYRDGMSPVVKSTSRPKWSPDICHLLMEGIRRKSPASATLSHLRQDEEGASCPGAEASLGARGLAGRETSESTEAKIYRIIWHLNAATGYMF
ncbi:hypothetical protein KUCAC02_033140, partial [Chaenocephalus aceratus]